MKKSNYLCPFGCVGEFDTKSEILAHIEMEHMDKDKGKGPGGKKSILKNSTKKTVVIEDKSETLEPVASGSGKYFKTFLIWNYSTHIDFF